jgi:hypothetical protein
MTRGVIGLNILGDRGYSEDATVEYVRQLNPAFCVVLNNPGLAAKLAAYTTTIARFTPDDDAQDKGSGADFVAKRAASVPSGGYLYLGNEPGRASAARLNQFTLEAQDEAQRRGLKLCVLNWSTGVPEPGDWEAVAPCIERSVRRGDLIGVHTYFMGDPLAGPSYPWHVGRWGDAQRRFGGQWVVTELGYDLDFKGQGWQGRIDPQTYGDDLAALADFHAEHGVAFCIFSWPEWDGHGFGIENATHIHPRLVALNQQYPLKEANVPSQPNVPANPGDPIPAVVRVTSLRLRAAPNGEPILRTLNLNETVTTYPATAQKVSGSSYSWVFLHDGQGRQGWSAPSDLNGNPWIVPVTPPPAPDTPKVHLAVPYVAQVSSSANHFANDCGVACALMLMAYALRRAGFLVARYPTVDEAAAHTSLPLHDDGLTLDELVTLLASYGVPAQVRQGVTPVAVRALLDAQQPVLVLCNYGLLNPPDTFDGGHFAVVVGYSDRGFWLNDPYHGGKDFYVTSGVLENALRDVLAFAQASYQGIVLS